MKKRAFNLAYVEAEIRAKIAIQKFAQEFENNGNQNQSGNVPTIRQDNNAQGNVPQQPQYSG
jgi:hypothetical protein